MMILFIFQERKIDNVLEKLNNPFKNVNSEYKRLKHLKDECCYEAPRNYIIGQKFETRK